MKKFCIVLLSTFLVAPTFVAAEEIQSDAAARILGTDGVSIATQEGSAARKKNKGTKDYSGFWSGTFIPKGVKAKKGGYSSFTCNVTTNSFNSAFQVQQSGKRAIAQFTSGYSMTGKAKKKLALKGTSGGVGLKISASANGKVTLLEIHKFSKGASCTIKYAGNFSYIPG
jgi:hypothetical protein